MPLISFYFPVQEDEVLLSGLLQFVKTADKIDVWPIFTDETELAMVVVSVSNLGVSLTLLIWKLF